MDKSRDQKTKKVKKGDRVFAIAGNDKGLTGTVKQVRGNTVVVEGLNVRKKHIKKTQEAPKGRIVEIERAIHVSNVKRFVEKA